MLLLPKQTIKKFRNAVAVVTTSGCHLAGSDNCHMIEAASNA